MNHLTFEEIIAFVSFTEINQETIALSAAVNGHIRTCDKCLRLVRAFQLIYDEFTALNTDVDFIKYVLDNYLMDPNRELELKQFDLMV